MVLSNLISSPKKITRFKKRGKKAEKKIWQRLKFHNCRFFTLFLKFQSIILSENEVRFYHSMAYFVATFIGNSGKKTFGNKWSEGPHQACQLKVIHNTLF